MGSDPVALDDALRAVADAQPLVQSITNEVTVNDVANVTLFWGGLPVMADDEREVAEMVATADALHLNMGTVSETGEETMVTAGRAANDHGVPVVFDPVGAGATATRTTVAERICEEVDVTVVSGNYGEVSTLAGDGGDVRGVESVGEYADIVTSARACAERTGTVVVASGEVDVVADATDAYRVSVGHPAMGQVVGTGCMQGVTLAAFCGGVDDPLSAALAGTAAFGIAGERAADAEYGGPASYKTRFLDAVGTLDAADLEDESLTERFEQVSFEE